MRTLACGQHLEAANDEELFERARERVDRVHPEMQRGDEQASGSWPRAPTTSR